VVNCTVVEQNKLRLFKIGMVHFQNRPQLWTPLINLDKTFYVQMSSNYYDIITLGVNAIKLFSFVTDESQ